MPMHSPSALTEHVSLNVARFFLLNPVQGKAYKRETEQHCAMYGRWRWDKKVDVCVSVGEGRGGGGAKMMGPLKLGMGSI